MIMKRILTFFAVLFVFTSVNAQLLTESFTFSGVLDPDPLTTVRANGWDAHSGAGTNAITTAGVAGLTYTGYFGAVSGSSNAAGLVPSGEDCNKLLSTPHTSGVLYYSFLIKPTAVLATKFDYITGLYESATLFPARMFIVANASATNFEFGISRGSGTVGATTANNYTLGETYLVTIKYEFVSGGTNDIISLFVQSGGNVSATEPASPTLTYSGATGADATTATGNIGIFLRQGTASNGITAILDEMRVATTWEVANPVIPVELIDFKARKAKSAVEVQWSTATELNNKYYSIERSSDAKSFEKIGEISVYGNSQTIRNYTFMDEKPLNSVNYYRLRQVDLDGKETVYKTVSVHFGKNGATKIYPTVVKDNINIELNTADNVSDLTVVNLLGQVVKAQKLQNTEGVISLNVSDLPNGSYILNVVSKSGNVSQQFKKQ
jgi:hypothetical protein